MPTVRAWFFDAVGTLIHPEPSAVAVYAAVGRRHGSRLSESDLAARFREAFRAEEQLDHAANWRTSERREEERWRRIVAHVLNDAHDSETVFAELWDHFSRPSAWRCDPDAAEVLTALDRRSATLGIASNFDGRLHSVLDGFPELRLLRHVVVSSEVGWRKPSSAFFDAVVELCDCRPNEVVLIGDDIVNDCDGGRAAGLQTVLLDPQANGSDWTNGRIQRLSDLIKDL